MGCKLCGGVGKWHCEKCKFRFCDLDRNHRHYKCCSVRGCNEGIEKTRPESETLCSTHRCRGTIYSHGVIVYDGR